MSLIDLPPTAVKKAVRELVRVGVEIPERGIVAGGFLRDILQGNYEYSDIDVFVVGEKESRRVQGLVDLVEVTSPTALCRVKEFDFTCCVAAIGKKGDGSWWGKCHPRFFQDCENMEIVMNKGWNKVTTQTVRRLKKFIGRGYLVSDAELVKIMRIVLGTPGDLPFEESPPPPNEEPLPIEEHCHHDGEWSRISSNYEPLHQSIFDLNVAPTLPPWRQAYMIPPWHR